MITTRDLRLILDRNQNGLDGRPAVQAGERAEPGLYWNPHTRVIVPMESATVADERLVLLSSRLDVTVDEIVRQLAMGGGARSGRPQEYRQPAVQHHH